MNEQLLQFENQGFAHLPGVIPPELVARVRKAFDQAANQHRAEWERMAAEKKANAQFYDIPDILDQDDCFVDLADLPSVMPLLLEAVGTDIQLNHTHARIMFPGKTFTAPWHTDLEKLIGINLATSPHFFAKVHFYFEDLLPDQGCLAFIPGTHRLPPGSVRPNINDVATSTAAVRIVPKAGDAVLFNVHVLHMALDNKTQLPRKSLIYAYSHFWLKNYANAVPRDVERHSTTALRRQLFGIETPGVSYFDQRLDIAEAASDYTSLRAASKRLINRLLKRSSVTKVK